LPRIFVIFAGVPVIADIATDVRRICPPPSPSEPSISSMEYDSCAELIYGSLSSRVKVFKRVIREGGSIGAAISADYTDFTNLLVPMFSYSACYDKPS